MSQNTIYFPFSARPFTGGDFVNLDHITGLNRLGFSAKAIYPASALEQPHFSIPTVKASDVNVTEHDIVVVAELNRDLFGRLKSVNCVKVMHNQNPFYTFLGFDTVQQLNAYPLSFIITSSEFIKRTLQELGVSKPIFVVLPYIPSYFSPAEKRFQIAFSPIKRSGESGYVKGVFKSRFPELARIPWLSLAKMSRQACAEAMAQSAIYAAFPRLEGLGLMSLEAMASGCHVVGFIGNGGVEYATDDNGMWVEEGDHNAFAAKLKEACDLVLSKAPNRYVENGIATASRYSQEAFDRQLKDAYMQIMGPLVDRYRL
jgi:hypothetical protein